MNPFRINMRMSAVAAEPIAPGLPASAAPTQSRRPASPEKKKTPVPGLRTEVDGKFLSVDGERFWVKGVTYGTFAPDADGNQFPSRERVTADFRLMKMHGFNSVRVYTVPPRWMLDVAEECSLKVMVGLPWEQHIAFLDDSKARRRIEKSVREGVRSCRGHSAVLCYSIGNEIPSHICRWHGPRRIEAYLRRLYDIAKAEDPDGLVTYVNFPSTEYLRLGFLDFITFNVYLEKKDRLKAYLARLQNLAGDKPLVMAEIGLDSQRNGANRQAEILSWQVGTTMAAGCSGAFIFSWTDEWWRGGHEIEDWDFGLVTRDRMPKPALTEVSNAFKKVPLPNHAELPSISVVVCTLNGSKTIRDTFEGLQKVDYPDFEVILIDDGSTDSTVEIAADYDVRVVSTPNRGLSAARNTGMEEAKGDIVVYLDDDAWPDRNWLRYIADAFLTHDYAAVGGPNISPPNTGDIADCVNNAPGGPVHVLLDDHHAEHIPGCNMAFRRSRLLELGGFDPQFRAAGDDVDLCWRVLEQGWTIGFAPAAMVWHHRRKSIRGYWKQQRGYGKAEALLERKWPEKYNTVGHVAWSGRLYGRGLTRMLGRVSRVYHGAWGSAAFQSRWDTPQHILRVLPTMPEWYLIVLGLGVISAMSVLWDRLLWFVPVFVAATGLTIGQAVWSASQAKFDTKGSRWKRLKLRAITSSLYIAQPIARLWGRLRHGLHAGRMHIPMNLASPFARTINIWREGWQAPEDKIRALLDQLRDDGAVIISGGNYDRWDFGVRGGLLAGARVLMTVEEHGAGKQMFRFIVWPRYSTEGIVTILVLAALAAGAVFDQAIVAYLIFTALTAVLAVRLLQEGAAALGAIEKALSEPFDEDPPAR